MARHQWEARIPWWGFRDTYHMVRGEGVGPVFGFFLACLGWCSTRLWKLLHPRQWKAQYGGEQRQDRVDST